MSAATSGFPATNAWTKIADAFAVGRDPGLYRGPLSGYSRSVPDVPSDTSLPKRSSGSSAGKPGKSSAKAYSYLSVVDGTPMRHSTWTECEQRVNGRSGARFKKATSAADELAIRREWRVDPPR